MFKIDCPNCEKFIDIENEELPQSASEDFEVECTHCEHKFKAGWYAELEVRDECL